MCQPVPPAKPQPSPASGASLCRGPHLLAAQGALTLPCSPQPSLCSLPFPPSVPLQSPANQPTTASFCSLISVQADQSSPGPPACSAHPFEALTVGQQSWPSARRLGLVPGPGSHFPPCRLPGPGCSGAHAHGDRDARMFASPVWTCIQGCWLGCCHSPESFLTRPPW